MMLRAPEAPTQDTAVGPSAVPSAGPAAPAGERVGGTPRPPAGRVREVIAQPKVNRWLRYAITSGLTTGISEVTLLALYASRLLGATGSSVIANLAGTVPSYLLSRYWIWPEAERSGAARQMGLYWATSAVSLVVTTAGASFAGAYAPAGHLDHVIVVGSAYVVTVALLWVAKFLVYQRVIFNQGPQAERSGTV